MTGISGGGGTSYAPQLLSHQTGVSYTPSTANTWANMGTSVTVPRNGIVKIILMGHISSSSYSASFQFTLKRGTTTYVVQDEDKVTSFNSSSQTSSTFISLSRYSYGISSLVLELPLLANDVLQLQGTVSSAGNTVYADDLVVILQ